jgi:23S rRNA (cytidine2498-2'-O)-methyltransferase
MTTGAGGFRMIGSSNRGFARYALEEIQNLFPGTEVRWLEPDEVFLFGAGVRRKEAVRTLREREPMFLRHVQPVERELGIDRTRADLDRIVELARDETRLRPGEKVAVQVRKMGGIPFDYTPYGVKEALDPVFVQRFGAEPVVRGADRIFSLYLTADRLFWGVSSPEENLSDWSGGMVRFRKEEGRVSRAEFKLLEAEERFGLRLDRFDRALDIGAALGGWTSLLLRRGLHVTAVDPSPMHPSLIGDPRITYLSGKADEVSFPKASFDLLVCDVNWSPRQTARLMAGLLPALAGGGEVILTVKLMRGSPFRTVEDVLAEFGEAVVPLHARQLFHNRKELTLHLRKHR